MFKKSLKLFSISLFTFGCAKSADALPVYVPFQIADSGCGNPNLGTWECNADNIIVTDYYNDMVKNNWLELNQENQGEFIRGASIDLASGNYNYVSASIDVSVDTQTGNCSNWDYHNGFNQPLYYIHVFSDNGIFLGGAQSSLTESAFNQNTGMCSIYAHAEIILNIWNNLRPGQKPDSVYAVAENLNSNIRNIGPIYPEYIKIRTEVSEK